MKRTHRAIVRACPCLAGHAGAWIIGLALVSMASLPGPAWCQSAWPSYPNNNTISVTSGGNVGIGTTTPVSPLHVVGSATQTNATFGSPDVGTLDILGLKIGGAGFVDLGSNIFFNGGWNLRSTANDGWLTAMNNTPGAAAGSQWAIYHVASGTNPGALSPFFFISASGNVGIGTTNPQYKLAVNGNIGAQDIIVTNAGWSDYVFQPGYRLRPLSEVGAYIQANRHLPDIPSETEVKEKGVSVGEMQSKLLAKVEELTLHMIRAEKESRQLRDRIARLEKGAVSITTTAAR